MLVGLRGLEVRTAQCLGDGPAQTTPPGASCSGLTAQSVTLTIAVFSALQTRYRPSCSTYFGTACRLPLSPDPHGWLQRLPALPTPKLKQGQGALALTSTHLTINVSVTIAAHAATVGWQKRLVRVLRMLRMIVETVFEMVFAGMITLGLAWAASEIILIAP